MATKSVEQMSNPVSCEDPALKMNGIELQMQGELPYKDDRGACRMLWGWGGGGGGGGRGNKVDLVALSMLGLKRSTVVPPRGGKHFKIFTV